MILQQIYGLPVLYWPARSSADCRYDKGTCSNGQEQGIINEIFIHYHCMDELLMIRRSTASESPKNASGKKVSLHTMMPMHTVLIVEPEYQEEEAIEAQWFLQVFARYDILFQTGLELMSFSEYSAAV